MISKADWELREAQWAAFHAWEDSREPDMYPPEDVFGALGTILEWLPEDVRMKDPDPGKLGIQLMHKILGMLSRRDDEA